MDIKINAILDSLEEYIDSKSSLMLVNRIMVNKSDMLEYIDNIRTELPSSVGIANKIYEDREAILSDAKLNADENIRNAENKAKQIVDEASATAAHLIDENEITRKAKIRAQEIIDNAEAEAARIMADCVEETESMRKDTYDFIEEKIERLKNTYTHAKNNVDYLKEEFTKNGASLFHILNTNIDKEFESIQGNQKAFFNFRESLSSPDYSDEDGEV